MADEWFYESWTLQSYKALSFWGHNVVQAASWYATKLPSVLQTSRRSALDAYIIQRDQVSLTRSRAWREEEGMSPSGLSLWEIEATGEYVDCLERLGAMEGKATSGI